MTEPIGDLIYTPEGFPGGVCCMDCQRDLEPGERYSRRLTGMTMVANEAANVVEIVCVPCGLKGAVQ